MDAQKEAQKGLLNFFRTVRDNKEKDRRGGQTSFYITGKRFFRNTGLGFQDSVNGGVCQTWGVIKDSGLSRRKVGNTPPSSGGNKVWQTATAEGE